MEWLTVLIKESVWLHSLKEIIYRTCVVRSTKAVTFASSMCLELTQSLYSKLISWFHHNHLAYFELIVIAAIVKISECKQFLEM